MLDAHCGVPAAEDLQPPGHDVRRAHHQDRAIRLRSSPGQILEVDIGRQQGAQIDKIAPLSRRQHVGRRPHPGRGRAEVQVRHLPALDQAQPADGQVVENGLYRRLHSVVAPEIDQPPAGRRITPQQPIPRQRGADGPARSARYIDDLELFVHALLEQGMQHARCKGGLAAASLAGDCDPGLDCHA